MPTNSLSNVYFNWIRNVVYNNAPESERHYDCVLRRLHQTRFTYKIRGDSSRENDGRSLRRKFLYFNDYPDSRYSELDIGDASVLEVIVALAFKMEEIMENPNFGNRTAVWIWGMFSSLGLLHLTDERYQMQEVDAIINRFIDREYYPNGVGGLFVIRGTNRNLRTVDIWTQMNMYLYNKT